MTDEFTKEEKKAFLYGLTSIFIFITVLLFVALDANDYKHVDAHFYHLNATFTRTDGLLIGDHVRMSGVDIGRVVEAKLNDHFNAVMKLEIKDTIQIPDDSSASIVSSSLMGRKYIEIAPGGSEEYFKDGDSFEQVQAAIILQEVVDRLLATIEASQKTNNTHKGKEDE